MPSRHIVFPSKSDELIETSLCHDGLLLMVAVVAPRSTFYNIHLTINRNRLLVNLIVRELQIPDRGCGCVILYLTLAIAFRERGNATVVLNTCLVYVCCHLPNIQPVWIQMVAKQLPILQIDCI